MSALLLLDLDDTLLKNNIDEFLPKYLDAFSSYLGGAIDPQRFVKSLMAGSQAMVQNRLPDCTLKEVFDAVFFPLAGLTPGEFQPVADRFYQEKFPDLHNLTEPVPQAQEMVKEALRRGYRLAVTTNPLFPLAAILQRLKWANLPADQYPFELISSYETFHFTKPDPAYFAEVLGRLGWPEGPVVVVGDDLTRDIIPAQSLGLAGYWADQHSVDEQPDDMPGLGHGSLEGMLAWIDASPDENLLPDYSSPEASIAILRSTPAVLDGFTRGLPEEAWAERPFKDEWSITEVICHLRDVDEEVNLPRLKAVIETSNPFIAGQDTDRWAESRGYCLQDGKRALMDFAAARHQIVKLLESLSPEDWDRPARHAIFGPTKLQELVKIQAAHDRLHQQQIRQLAAR
ncbi:MAG: DinB family protein [Anaerolineales bacterium]|nr:DinB family protein [Anaerolineales bacterium]